MPLGYELIVTGLNPLAARYAGIDVSRRFVLAAFLAGGLGGLAGMVEVLGAQHRLMDGISGGISFVRNILVLLAGLKSLVVIPTAFFLRRISVRACAPLGGRWIHTFVQFIASRP